MYEGFWLCCSAIFYSQIVQTPQLKSRALKLHSSAPRFPTFSTSKMSDDDDFMMEDDEEVSKIHFMAENTGH
jgi:hypothetical protein